MVVAVASCPVVRSITGEHRTTISYGPEDLSCWRGRHQLWTVGEHPKRRALYGVPDQRCG
jgi:hypothetical protein